MCARLIAVVFGAVIVSIGAGLMTDLVGVIGADLVLVGGLVIGLAAGRMQR